MFPLMATSHYRPLLKKLSLTPKSQEERKAALVAALKRWARCNHIFFFLFFPVLRSPLMANEVTCDWGLLSSGIGFGCRVYIVRTSEIAFIFFYPFKSHLKLHFLCSTPATKCFHFTFHPFFHPCSSALRDVGTAINTGARKRVYANEMQISNGSGQLDYCTVTPIVKGLKLHTEGSISRFTL